MTSYRVEQITGASAVEQNLLEELLNTEQCRRKDRKIWGLKDYLVFWRKRVWFWKCYNLRGGGHDPLCPPVQPALLRPWLTRTGLARAPRTVAARTFNSVSFGIEQLVLSFVYVYSFIFVPFLLSADLPPRLPIPRLPIQLAIGTKTDKRRMLCTWKDCISNKKGKYYQKPDILCYENKPCLLD